MPNSWKEILSRIEVVGGRFSWKKISEEQQAIEPVEPIPPRRSTKISRPPKRYIGMLTEDVEKIFLMGDMNHVDNPKIYDEAISDIDSEK